MAQFAMRRVVVLFVRRKRGKKKKFLPKKVRTAELTKHEHKRSTVECQSCAFAVNHSVDAVAATILCYTYMR